MSDLGLVRALWWRLADDFRAVIRFVGGRYSAVAFVGIVARWLAHVVAGNVPQVVALLIVLALPFGPLVGSLVWLLAALLFELWYQVRLASGRGSWLHGWRLWMRVRRALPAEWNEAASKSKGIRTRFGGESKGSTTRPVADHPKTGWFPSVEWPVVSVRCGHPPGRAPSEFTEFQTTMAANILRVDAVEFDFARSRDSVGWLHLTFVDVLDRPVVPVDSRPDLRLVIDDEKGVA